MGADVASTLGLKDADALDVLGKKFTVTAVLPQTGTVDDSRIFAHLHTVQDLTKKGHVINVIEIIGCCHEFPRNWSTKSIICCPTPRWLPSRKPSNRSKESMA